ncbi:hypothetical protein RRG08_014635 [Elysia crispata]|uniref:Uncharacterized protein n=1 Tax=Elysia crispata TaxID=231223 RepID=A0AAE1D394_9GAST|nr:hypothetical protein RRG08_014635 [Elysia crispata]
MRPGNENPSPETYATEKYERSKFLSVVWVFGWQIWSKHWEIILGDNTRGVLSGLGDYHWEIILGDNTRGVLSGLGDYHWEIILGDNTRGVLSGLGDYLR